MAIVRFSPFHEFETLRNQMDRLFEDLTNNNYRSDIHWQPAVEMSDQENNIVVKASLPGVEPKDIDVSVSRNAVKITGEHTYENKTENKGFYHSEFSYGRFERTIKLPVAVQNDQVKAEFNNGILILSLPKVEGDQNKVVKVKL
ncbi:Hsp20/alpha crystallin family protein [Merismopedia glauca]|uniref:Molecular chaperone n=1 Tax=Merismopedia glauca CCAP 1448/3 TaxID=1296344 RepID=A0A2T1BXE9_9CYAN|nr:Hsp20/alpha crystallin family protein [Merismopedia glauca]PSB00604.1 molecular chaperone [Merismopedia glauca CCAP 1448/3]